MPPIHRWPVLTLLAGLSAVLGGCVAVPVAQLASQALAPAAANAPEVAQLPDAARPAQLVHGLKSMLPKSLGIPGTEGEPR